MDTDKQLLWFDKSNKMLVEKLDDAYKAYFVRFGVRPTTAYVSTDVSNPWHDILNVVVLDDVLPNHFVLTQ